MLTIPPLSRPKNKQLMPVLLLSSHQLIICRIQRDVGGAESVQRGISASLSLNAVASTTMVLI
ncbi:hypothetical protein PTUN_b0058 [Pseudoalteromonas tunicata]|jgi:hypothetical protein|uniref:Uncharacterized protein n=1 Tax=Pseudoalteromonas tunicata D2 TaxID=87626 RepID=A4C3R1_9GAMM|nr:hypothetical protein PTUN_b0058 [Pseudoalteromonas tunicata]EAR30193.1 hypothetical protein PTD2_01451 [Pseudoalteromonas tunicata D2]